MELTVNKRYAKRRFEGLATGATPGNAERLPANRPDSGAGSLRKKITLDKLEMVCYIK